MAINLLQKSIPKKSSRALTFNQNRTRYIPQHPSFAALVDLFFVLQIVAGISLPMYYTVHVNFAITSDVQRSMRETTGHPFQCFHSLGFFIIFTVVYIGWCLYYQIYTLRSQLRYARTAFFLFSSKTRGQAPIKSAGLQLLLFVTIADVRESFYWLLGFFDRYEWLFLNTLYCLLAAWFICYVLRIFVRSRHRLLYGCCAIGCLHLYSASAVSGGRAVTCFLAKNNPSALDDGWYSRELITTVYPSIASRYDVITTLSEIFACLLPFVIITFFLYFAAPVLSYDIWVALTILRSYEAAGIAVNARRVWFLTCVARFLEIIRVKAGRVAIVPVACVFMTSMGIGYWFGALYLCYKINYKADFWSLVFLDYKMWDPVPLAEVLSVYAPLIVTVVTVLVLLILERLWTGKDE